MATFVVQHGVADYATWRQMYDEVEPLRLQHGCTEKRVWRSPENANSLLVLHDFPTIEQAQAFGSSPELKAAMQRGGVSGAPRIEIWEDVDG